MEIEDRIKAIPVGVETFHALLEERAHLRQQVKELQEAATAQENRHRAASLACQVREFHAAFGQPVHDTPHVPDEGRIRFRLRLIAEEFCELLNAVLGVGSSELGIPPENKGPNWPGDAVIQDGVGLAAMWAELRERIDADPLDVNLPDFVDAMADLDYVVEGTRLEFGVCGAPIAKEVHRANMAKLHACAACKGTGRVNEECGGFCCIRCGGRGKFVQMKEQKVIKPGGWTPPDIRGVLLMHGWQP